MYGVAVPLESAVAAELEDRAVVGAALVDETFVGDPVDMAPLGIPVEKTPVERAADTVVELVNMAPMDLVYSGFPDAVGETVIVRTGALELAPAVDV